MAKSTRKKTVRPIVKSVPKVNKYTKGSDASTSVVGEPEAGYERKAATKKPDKRPRANGYDAKRSSGMIPGIAERMKEYLKTMRDDR